jgi:hypothetical protein
MLSFAVFIIHHYTYSYIDIYLFFIIKSLNIIKSVSFLLFFIKFYCFFNFCRSMLIPILLFVDLC